MIIWNFPSINIRDKNKREHYREAKIIHLCGRHHFDLCHPLLLSVGVYSLDQQGRSRGWSALKSPCSVNYSVVLYPKVRWIAAFEPHQTTSATADELHCKREAKGSWFKIRQTEGKGLINNWWNIKPTKGFLIIFAYTIFTSSCCPKVQLKTGEVSGKWMRTNLRKNRKCAP